MWIRWNTKTRNNLDEERIKRLTQRSYQVKRRDTIHWTYHRQRLGIVPVLGAEFSRSWRMCYPTLCSAIRYVGFKKNHISFWFCDPMQTCFDLISRIISVLIPPPVSYLDPLYHILITVLFGGFGYFGLLVDSEENFWGKLGMYTDLSLLLHLLSWMWLAATYLVL